MRYQLIHDLTHDHQTHVFVPATAKRTAHVRPSKPNPPSVEGVLLWGVADTYEHDTFGPLVTWFRQRSHAEAWLKEITR